MTATLLRTETLPIGTRFDYSVSHEDGSIAYTHVLVRPGDVIRRDIVPATTVKPAKNAKYEMQAARADAPASNARYEVLMEKIGTSTSGNDMFRQVRGELLDPGTVRVLVDPGTNEVPLLAKNATTDEVHIYVTALMAAKEEVWIANKSAKTT